MIKGSIVAIVTPMHSNGDLDLPTLEKLLHWHTEQKTDAIVILGTTGEAPTLTADEKKSIISLTVKSIDGKLPVIVGTGTNATQASIENTQAAKSLGADGCMTVVPYYNKPTQEGLLQHFTAIADAVELPQILYNHSGRCVIDMDIETTAALSRHKNIVGIKEGPSDPERCKKIRAVCQDDFLIYSGDDINAMNFILAGAEGHISVAANMFPAKMHQLCKAAIEGDNNTATELNEQLTPFFDALGVETNPIPIKWALHSSQLMEDGIRLPLTPLSIKHRDALMDTMNRIPSL